MVSTWDQWEKSSGMITIIRLDCSQSMHCVLSCRAIALLLPATLILPLSPLIQRCRLGRSQTKKCASQVSDCIHTFVPCSRLVSLIKSELNLFNCSIALFYYPKQELNTVIISNWIAYHMGFLFLTLSSVSLLFSQFTYYPVEWIHESYLTGLESCSSASLDGKFGSLCAEKLFTDIPGYYKPVFDGFGYSGPSFGYVSLLFKFDR